MKRNASTEHRTTLAEEMTTEWFLTRILKVSLGPLSQHDGKGRIAGAQDKTSRDATDRLVEVQGKEVLPAVDTVIDRSAGVLDGVIPIGAMIGTGTVMMSAEQNAVDTTQKIDIN